MSVPGIGALIAVTFTLQWIILSASRARERWARILASPRRSTSRARRISQERSAGWAIRWCARRSTKAPTLTRAVRFSALKRWALEVAKRRGMRRAKVALARKLAVIVHRMWIDGTTFRWNREGVAA